MPTGMTQSIVITDVSGRKSLVNASGRLLVDAAGVSVSASGIALNISGQTVFLASGQNNVQISGDTVIALISGQTVVGSFSATVSGQVVYLTSGQNNVQMSGQTVIVPSTSVSGNMVSISGQFLLTQVFDSSFLNSAEVSQPSDDAMSQTTTALETIAYLYAKDIRGSNFVRPRVTSSGQGVSGALHRLVVAFSGDNVFEHGSALITNPLTQVIDASGGVVLSSGSVFSVTLNNISGNAPVWVGGIGTQAPFSGKGLIVYPGGGLSVKVDSVDDIRVFGEVSGQFVSWIGVQK